MCTIEKTKKIQLKNNVEVTTACIEYYHVVKYFYPTLVCVKDNMIGWIKGMRNEAFEWNGIKK